MKEIFNLGFQLFKLATKIAILVLALIGLAVVIGGRLEMNIQYYRKENGMTIQQLADAAELPKRTVEEAIRRDTCSVKTAIKLADALGVTLDALCRDLPEESTE